MAAPTPMPKGGAREPVAALTLPQLAQQLIDDGAGWARAELVLARAEAVQSLRRVVGAAIVASVAAVVALTAALVLAQALVAALAPYLHGPALAGLAVGVGLLCAAAIAAIAARRLLAHPARPASLIFKWLMG